MDFSYLYSGRRRYKKDKKSKQDGNQKPHKNPVTDLFSIMTTSIHNPFIYSHKLRSKSKLRH